jgi:hypothetical protein
MTPNTNGNQGGLDSKEFADLLQIRKGDIKNFCGTTDRAEICQYASLNDWNIQKGIKVGDLTEFAKIGRPDPPVSITLSGNFASPQMLDGYPNVVFAYDKIVVEPKPLKDETEGNTYHYIGLALPNSPKVVLFQTKESYVKHWCKADDIKYEGDQW